MKVVNTLRKLGHACRGMLAVACLWSMSGLLFTACDSENPEENIDPMYAVDLGLSVKWAWCNVGASRPEEYGDYFAWGELATKSSFERYNYAYYDSSQGDYEDIGENISGTAYDVARDLWGDGWRLPTEEEMRELVEECTWEKGFLYGSDGMFVTGPNGNKIFLPNASGGYWSGTYSSTNYNYKYSSALTWKHSAPWLNGLSAEVQVGEETCYTGLAIRPVKGKQSNSNENTDDEVGGDNGNADDNTNTDEPLRVDLGLSVEWASCNVGAESPEEYGDYFAWGEITTKSEYTTSNSITYGLSNSELESRGIIGDDGNLTAEYDAATVNWGGNWRMPTLDEMKELVDECTWSWTTQNGVYGRKVTGPNGNSIFLPAAGYRFNESLRDVGSDGLYWSAAPGSDSDYACLLFFFNDNYYRSTGSRHCGLAVRSVYSDVPSRVLAIETGEATDITTEGATLNGVVKGADESISCGFIYGTSSDMSSLNNKRIGTTSDGAYSMSISYLQPNTIYYYCAYVIIDGEERYGEVYSFTTEQVSNVFINGYEAVDLGLSVKWASCNVGAESPEEYGDYFAWGETATKSSYDESNSAIYGLSISELESRGIIDAAGNLTAAYDAATVNWGEGWRMPTTAEIQELIDNCTWKWTTNDGTISGVYGYEVTAPNGNSIFLPPAGYYRNMSPFFAESYGYYASVTNSMDGGVYCLHFRQGVRESYNFDNRAYGMVVRPVSE